MNSNHQNGLLEGPDGQSRCWWQGNDPLYLDYHDQEWGRPCYDDRYLFEKICLEGFQAGLSWITILRKRENFRRAFADFDIEKLSRFTEKDVERLMQDAGIVRHRGKIESVVNNAKRAKELVAQEGPFSDFLWQFKPALKERPQRMDYESVRVVTQTDSSKALSKALKSRGWTFFGPTTAYAFMQAVGMVNDHLHGCVCRQEIEEKP